VVEDGDNAVQCEEHDQRVTSVGRYLRKLSIDELPQLVNVVLGNMSLVGPRPHVPALDREQLSVLPGYMDRYLVKPGITGLAQISGYRGSTTLPGSMYLRLKADLEYMRKRSIWLDVWILVKTIPAILLRQNAY
jgi:putative colanic acid biosynthesis UDP-glucose lipid carrier transferase